MTRHSSSKAIALGAVLMAAALAGAASAETNIGGHWGRYPGRGVTADPKLVAPRAGEPDLKAPWAGKYKDLRSRQRASDEAGEPLANASTECKPEGMPKMMAAIYPLEILQTPGQVTIFAEVESQSRRIYLGEKSPEIDEIPPGYFGYSTGRWEGDTLVVETVGVREDVEYREIPHSEKARIKERIRLLAPDILQDVVTVEDPDRLNKPYTVTFAYKKMPNYKIQEYVCENNRSYIDDKGVTRLKLEPQ